MMTAPTLQHVWPGVFRWAVFSPEHRVELASHAVQGPSGLVVFDPIALADEALDRLCAAGQPVAIVLTNANHGRDAAAWRTRYGCEIYGPPEGESGIVGARCFGGKPCPLPSWEAIPLPGGAPGETAFLLPVHSLVVLGDAVVNLPQRGLELLPDKYCTAPGLLRIGLRKLVDRTFARAVMAHGEPIPADAARRISELL